MDSTDKLEKPKEGDKTWQYVAALSAALGSFALGTVLGYSSPALPKMQDDPVLHLSDNESSLVGSLANVGFMFSGVITGFFLARLGRKTTMMLLSVPYIIGWILIISAVHVSMLYIGRIITGFCSGAFSVAVPVYIAETAEVSIRGQVGNYFELMNCLGILFCYLVGWGVSWQWLAAISSSIPLIFTMIFYFMPESPMYSCSKGRQDAMRKALLKLRGPQFDLELEIENIERIVRESKERKGTLRDLFKGVNFKLFRLCLGLMTFQQLSGVNTVVFFNTQIFESAGMSLDPSASVCILGLVQSLSTYCSTHLIDRVGRKALLLISGSGMGISLVFLGLAFYFVDTANVGVLPLVSLMTFIISSAIGFGPVTWTVMGEIFPLEVKELATSIATSYVWFMAFVTTVTFTPLIKVMQLEGVYWMYSGFNFLGVAFVYFFLKETKGKTQEQIMEDYR